MSEKQIRIGTCILGKRPRIVGVVDRVLSDSGISSLKDLGADMLEIRADLLKKDFLAILEYAKYVRQKSGLPCIATIRPTRENKNHRSEMFGRIIPLVDAVDIELNAVENKEVINSAKKHNKKVIVSEHDFESTPANARLAGIVQRAKKQGADIVKIAAMAKNREDAARLMMFASKSRLPIVAISMGDHGSVTRIAAPLFGSLFTYAFITRPVAPGQLSLKETSGIVRRYYPV